MGLARKSGRGSGQGKKGLQAGAQPQQVMGGAGEAQLVLGRQLPHLAVDVAVHADAEVVAAVL